MNTITLNLTSTSPMLMHSDRLANPISDIAKAHKVLTGKRKKTEDDQIAIARSEFNASLYLDADKRVCIPTINLRAAFIEGAKLNKLGAAFQRGTMILEETSALNFKGEQNPDRLFDNAAFVDCRSVVVSRARLMRYRPKFNDWSLSVAVLYDPLVIDRDDVLRSCTNAGLYIGLGDFRPAKRGPFGRFAVDIASENKMDIAA